MALFRFTLPSSLQTTAKVQGSYLRLRWVMVFVAPALVFLSNDENRVNNNIYLSYSHRFQRMRKIGIFSPSQPTSPCQGSCIWKWCQGESDDENTFLTCVFLNFSGHSFIPFSPAGRFQEFTHSGQRFALRTPKADATWLSSTWLKLRSPSLSLWKTSPRFVVSCRLER